MSKLNTYTKISPSQLSKTGRSSRTIQDQCQFELGQFVRNADGFSAMIVCFLSPLSVYSLFPNVISARSPVDSHQLSMLCSFRSSWTAGTSRTRWVKRSQRGHRDQRYDSPRHTHTVKLLWKAGPQQAVHPTGLTLTPTLSQSTLQA